MNPTRSTRATFFQSRVLPLRSGAPASRGFTLVELLMVLCVAGILLTLSVPSFGRIISSSRLTAASNALLSSMYLARSEAIKRHSRVALCKTVDGMACAATGGWEQGWIVFSDINNNGVRDSDEPIIERIQGLPTIRATGNSPVAKYVSYVATGSTRLIGGGLQAGTVTVCAEPGTSDEARQIVISSVGRPRIQKVSASVCT
jgi:type IV fimbrial biogenesis protein FimT